MIFFFASSELLQRSRFISALTKPVTGAVLKYELILDQRMIGAIADKDTKLQGMKLGRFDKPLGAIRTRIDRLYRGKTAVASTSQDGPIPISVVKTAAGK
jgi:vanillate O-demethylase monooxygenase subunit